MEETLVKREPLAAHLSEVRMVMGGVTLVASPSTRGEVQLIPRERSPDREVLWEAWDGGGRFQVVVIRGKGAYLASYSGPRAHYLRLDPHQVAGLVGALLEALELGGEGEYIDIDTAGIKRVAWPRTQAGALLSLVCGAFRQSPDLGRKVLEAALKAYVEDVCSSLRAGQGEGGGTGGKDGFFQVLRHLPRFP